MNESAVAFDERPNRESTAARYRRGCQLTAPFFVVRRSFLDGGRRYAWIKAARIARPETPMRSDATDPVSVVPLPVGDGYELIPAFVHVLLNELE
jgi:hypothetical protein